MTKHSKDLLKALRQINGILNKEFYGFDKNTLTLLEDAEGVECYSVALTEYEDIAKVITKDSREYLIFQDSLSADEYAIATGVSTEDDPHLLAMIKEYGKSLEQYYKHKVVVNGAEYVLSYDQKHKLRLPNGAIAYRIE